MTRDLDPPDEPRRRLRRQLTELAERFLLRTRGQVVQMRELLERASADDLDVIKQVQDIAHKIHGSGAVFGFQAISESGGEVERQCGELTSAPSLPSRAPGGDFLENLKLGIARVGQAVEEAYATR